jgi:hypothetical protein
MPITLSITECEPVVNSLLRTLTCTVMNTTGTLLLELHCLQSLLWTTESDMRRTQRRVLLRVTSLRLRGPSLLLRHPVLPRQLSNARCGAKRGEGRGGKTGQRSATVAQSRSLGFLNFSSSRMGRLRHTIYWHNYNNFEEVNCVSLLV